MPKKISSISSEVWVKTWRFPTLTWRPGKVTSIVSEASCCWIFAAATFWAVSSKAAVSTSRTSLTCLPTIGFISLDRSFKPFNKSVKDPFLPKTATRRSCSSFSPWCWISFNFSSVVWLNSANCCSMFDIIPPIKKRMTPLVSERCHAVPSVFIC